MGILLKKGSKLLAFLSKQKKVKLKGSTLVETLVATVLIVTIFSIASLTLNTIFKSIVQKQINKTVDTRLNELKYFYNHKKVSDKYMETFKGYSISISKKIIENQSVVSIEAIEKTTKKNISKQFVDAVSE